MLRHGPSGRLIARNDPVPDDDRIWEKPKKRPPMSETLTLKITGEDRRGSLDGVTATDFPAGSVHTFSGRLGADLGRAFLRYGWAEEYEEPAPAPEPKQAVAPENKQAPAPENKARSKRKPARRKRTGL